MEAFSKGYLNIQTHMGLTNMVTHFDIKIAVVKEKQATFYLYSLSIKNSLKISTNSFYGPIINGGLSRTYMEAIHERTQNIALFKVRFTPNLSLLNFNIV